MADLTYGQLRDALQAAIAATIPDSDDSYHWIYVCDFSDTFVVYCDEDEYLQDDYTLDGEDITLAGNPQPVKAVTTYEPLSAATPKTARVSVSTRSVRASSNLDLLTRDPEEVRGLIAQRLGGLGPEAMSSELVYSPTARVSYYRDFLAYSGKIDSPGFEQRLTRHAEQMANVNAERRKRAEQQLRAGGFEFRVEPNTTDGQGGYFSPPIWLNQLFATANRPRRVLADLMRKFALPPGVSQVNLPIIGTGTINQPDNSGTAVPAQDITDSAGQSNVVPFAGMADVSLQVLEMSPPGAHLDWAIFTDLSEAYDASLETGLIAGVDGASGTLLGVTQLSGINTVTFTNGSPTGALLYPFLGQAFAQVSNNRDAAPQCWLMRGSRWAWIKTSEGSDGLPFDIAGLSYLGSTDATPDPIGGLVGLPVFLEEAISNTQGAGQNQDVIIALRPTDMILLEGQPQTMVAREPLSGSLGARIEMHSYAAALTDRRPAGVAIISGTGLAKQSGF